ncbi:L-fucose mutarotase [Pullulanibacillus pueri]|uniref:Fucose isomerase n=1 Tax=Pullulanibacillus pueri TaxID=1437324 RepID=A0A8J2ZWB0_9BACL|nr:L-fucose mutarotase [Pullulanibacillus pueri]MBM7680926.1 L-fucose mutarotase [Pullulanibacillus pueri]GGH81362.1 fucose isomerase [Pullulanibacillus pueri]
MLRGISRLISPSLIKVLMEMGHGDEIVFADGNFPAASHAERLVSCDGHQISDLLEAILPLFPLDEYVSHPATLMKVVEGDTVRTPIWNHYQNLLQKYTEVVEPFDYVERFAFYERAKKAYAIVATGENALYANIILRKGIISPPLKE